MRAYFDSVVMIYLVERVPPWHARLVSAVSSLGWDLVASDLCRMECRVKPLQLSDVQTLADFDTTFAAIEIIPLDSAVFDRAADIRATYRFKTPDAIHLAAAVEHGCDVFVTNDHRLNSFSDIAIHIV
jgi:predicted nucleic acid-binding protein